MSYTPFLIRQQLERLHRVFPYEYISSTFERFKDIPPGTLSDIVRGKDIPEKYYDQLDIRVPKIEYARTRREKLDDVARAHGWKSWSAFETAVVNDIVEGIPYP